MNIDLESVFFNYKDTPIVQNLNYCFDDGIYLIRGKSGIGKTTILNLIIGYIQPITGRIKRENAKIEYMMQETMLFNNLTVKENLFLKHNINTVFEKDSFNELINSKLQEIGLDTDIVDKKVSYLSGGQKRKLELVLISLNDANVFLMDEPIANLDEESIEQIVYYIENNLMVNKIVIISSHSKMNFTCNVKFIELENYTLKNKKM